MSHSLPRRRHERHPVGLLMVIGLHVLLGLAMLTARLSVDVPPMVRAALAKIDPPLQPPPAVTSHALPDASPMSLRRIVAPLPEVVVDRADAIQAAPLAVTPGPAPAAALPGPAPVAAAPAPAGGTNDGMAGGRDGNGVAGGRHVPARDAFVYADAPQCQPPYPESARKMHVAGTTRLRFTVDAAGRIVDVKLLRRSGQMPEHFLLDRAAMEALSHCPVAVGNDESGNPAGGTTDVDYIWQLR